VSVFFFAAKESNPGRYQRRVTLCISTRRFRNTQGGAEAPAVTSLASKMRNRRGMCKLGFLCSANSISNDARNHELRYSHEESVMVLLDGKDLDGLLDKADQLEVELERLVVNASLR
jgi:hypothetical protein